MSNKKLKIIRPFIVTKDPMVQNLLHKFAKRSEDGIKKYNVTMVQAKKPIEKWISIWIYTGASITRGHLFAKGH